MSKRTLIAAAVLVVWAGALGWHVKREYFPSRAAQLTRGARSLPPGPAYYRLTWQDRRLGWARVQLDTIPGGGFRLATLLEMEAGALGLPGSLRAETTARLGRDLGLEQFTARAEGPLLSGLSGPEAPSPGPGAPELPIPSGTAEGGASGPDEAGTRGGGDLRSEGRVAGGDSVLVAWVERGGRRDTFRVPTGGDLVPLGAVPLRLAADPRVAPGRRVGVRLLDPRALSVRRTELEVVEEAMRSYPDSARKDSSSGRWVPVTRDTVRAWKVRRPVGGVPVTAWVDEDGRLLEASLGSALRLERTAFEMAYFAADSGGAAGAGRGPPPGGAPDSRPRPEGEGGGAP